MAGTERKSDSKLTIDNAYLGERWGGGGIGGAGGGGGDRECLSY